MELQEFSCQPHGEALKSPLLLLEAYKIHPGQLKMRVLDHVKLLPYSAPLDSRLYSVLLSVYTTAPPPPLPNTTNACHIELTGMKKETGDEDMIEIKIKNRNLPPQPLNPTPKHPRKISGSKTFSVTKSEVGTFAYTPDRAPLAVLFGLRSYSTPSEVKTSRSS